MEQDSIVQPGMTVLDSGGAEIGVVEQVQPSPDGSGTLVLLSGATGAAPLTSDMIESVDGNNVRLRAGIPTAPAAPASSGAQTSQSSGGSSLQGQTQVIDDDVVRVERYEENLIVDKEVAQVDTVRIHKRVVEEPQTITTELAYEEYEVERIPVNRAWKPGDDSFRQEGDVLIVPILGEIVEVMRRKVVVEELRLTKRIRTEQREVTETVRKEVVDLEGPVVRADQLS